MGKEAAIGIKLFYSDKKNAILDGLINRKIKQLSNAGGFSDIQNQVAGFIQIFV